MSSSGKLKIPLQEISLATNGFAKDNIIGEGGYGNVYRGQSKQYGVLAIKRLIISGPYPQGDHEYGMEVTLLSKYKHENLVSLIGFCGDGGEKILVYKFEANGSLDRVLHKNDLSWIRRLQICRDAAHGLRYLHNESGSQHSSVIHRDIKSSNILLDENWKAKISDFGLSKIALTNSAESVVFTTPCGTPGYVDPQILYGGITQKSDVYSFGVVLYEVLFGKLVAIPGTLDDRRFTVEKARKHHQEKTLHMMILPHLKNEMSSDSLSTFSTLAYQCVEIRTEDRPTMSSVVEALEKALDYQQVIRTKESFGSSSAGLFHDVYISFRVEASGLYDMFTNLCDALEKEGLSPYKGNIENSSNESVLLSAIKQSRSFIIIFSKNFGASSWNLKEVAEIVKCMKERGSVVLPVFSANVYPSEVREGKGYFGQSISKHDSHPSMEVWRNALVEATNVPGLQTMDFEYYKDFVKEVAARIKGNSKSSKPTVRITRVKEAR